MGQRLAKLDDYYGLFHCKFHVYTKPAGGVSLIGYGRFTEHHFIAFQLKKNFCYIVGYVQEGVYVTERNDVSGTFAKTIAQSFNVSDFVQIVRKLDETKTYNLFKYNCKNFVKDVEVYIRKKSAKKTITANDNHTAKNSMTSIDDHVSDELSNYSTITTNEEGIVTFSGNDEE